jgi:site-specific recombinase XerD
MAHRKLPSPEEMPAVFHEWLLWLPLQEDKPATTIRAYSQGVRRIVCLAELSPKQFSADAFSQRELTDVLQTMRASDKPDPSDSKKTVPEFKKATLSQTMAAMKSFLDFCVTDGLVNEVPDLSRIRKVSQLEVVQKEPVYYSSSDLKSLYRTAATEIVDNDTGGLVRWAERDLAMVAVLAGLGLRAAEIMAIDIDWINRDNLDDSTEQVLRVFGKGSKVRYLPLSPELVKVIDRWMVVREERFGKPMADDPLFVTRDQERFNYRRLRYWLLTLNRASGLRDRSLHALRHTAGVQWARCGVGMFEVQSLLGHASIKTTAIYTEVAAQGLIDAVRASGANQLITTTLQEIDQ